MKKNKTTDMTVEYMESIRQIEESLAQCREALKRAKEQRRRHIVSKLNSNIAALYRQRSELLEIVNRLNTYYSNEEDKKAG